MVLLLKRVWYLLADLMCFFAEAGLGLYESTRCRLAKPAAALSSSLFFLRLAWPWRLACVEFPTGLLRAG